MGKTAKYGFNTKILDGTTSLASQIAGETDNWNKLDNIIPKFSLTSADQVIDCNTLQPGIYITGASVVNQPSALTYWYIICIWYNGDSQQLQLAYPYLPANIAAGNKPRFRAKFQGTWSSWEPM